MKNAPENLYLMADGTYAAPGDVSKGKDGVLRHKNGVHVALRDNGEPYTIGHGLETNKNVEAAEVGVSDVAPPDVVDDGGKAKSEVGKTEINPATGKKDDDADDEAQADEPAKAVKR